MFSCRSVLDSYGGGAIYAISSVVLMAEQVFFINNSGAFRGAVLGLYDFSTFIADKVEQATLCFCEIEKWDISLRLLIGPFEQWSHAESENTFLNQSWIKLYVNIQVYLSEEPLYKLYDVTCEGSIYIRGLD